MRASYLRMRQIFKRFNKHAFTWEDLLRICQKYRINVVFVKMSESVKGYYTTTLKKKYRKKYIVLNESLNSVERLFVALHELIHHFLHVTDQRHQLFYCRTARFIESKEEVEAYSMALMMLIPKTKLFEMCEENVDYMESEKVDYFIQRKWLYQNNKTLEDQQN